MDRSTEIELLEELAGLPLLLIRDGGGVAHTLCIRDPGGNIVDRAGAPVPA